MLLIRRFVKITENGLDALPNKNSETTENGCRPNAALRAPWIRIRADWGSPGSRGDTRRPDTLLRVIATRRGTRRRHVLVAGLPPAPFQLTRAPCAAGSCPGRACGPNECARPSPPLGRALLCRAQATSLRGLSPAPWNAPSRSRTPANPRAPPNPADHRIPGTTTHPATFPPAAPCPWPARWR